VLGITGHQAGAHPAYFAATAVDLELGASGQRQHQLMVIVRVFMGLVVQAQQAGIEHARKPRGGSKPASL